MPQQRTVFYEGNEISYQLEQKPVKNLNLRIHKDCKVYVSANPEVPVNKVDEFVVSKGQYICSAQKKFGEMALYSPKPKQYVSGETFYILGKGVRLKVEQASHNTISSDGVYLNLCIKDPQDFEKKKRMVSHFLDCQCDTTFGEIMSEIYPVFQKYGVAVPVLRLSIYFCVQLPERTNHRSFPANGRLGHSENVDKVSIRYGVSVQFSEKRVRQWTRLALWPLFSPTFCGSKPLISSRLLRQAEASIPSFCLSTNGCRCCSNTRSCLKV